MQFDTEILIRLLLAALWGGIVGAERQYRSKSAGFRTMIMISMGACFFTMMSMLIGDPANRDRIASNIVTGIGFLGAGVIFRGENRVNGITTAATIWTVAAVGMGIGAGHYFASACASILVLFVLAVLPYMENFIDKLNQSKLYSVTCIYKEGIASHFGMILEQSHLKFKLTSQAKEGNEILMKWETQGHSKSHAAFVSTMLKLDFIKKFEY